MRERRKRFFFRVAYACKLLYVLTSTQHRLIITYSVKYRASQQCFADDGL